MKGLRLQEEAPIDELRGATRRAAEELVDLAVQEQVDFVVLAGDIFDGDWQDVGTGLFFNRQLSRLGDAGIPVYLIRGNHDAESVISRTLTYPPNVYEFSTAKVETLSLDGLEVALHGRGFPERKLNENIVPDYPAAVPGKYNIGVLHTSLAGSDEHDTYAPCSLDDLIQAGYDYWALGHIHQPGVRHENPWVVYSGNTQGRHIRETGERGCYLVSVTAANETSVEFRSLDTVRWQLLELDITDNNTAASLLDQLDNAMVELLGETQNLTSINLVVIRLVLTGTSALASMLELRRDYFGDEFLSVMQRHHGGKIWLESLRLQVSSETSPIEHAGLQDDIASEVLAALQPQRMESTFARESWDKSIEKVLKELNVAQLTEVESLLPDALQSTKTNIAKNAGAEEESGQMQQTLQLESGSRLEELHPFFIELRNLTLSAINLPPDDSDDNPPQSLSANTTDPSSVRQRVTSQDTRRKQ